MKYIATRALIFTEDGAKKSVPFYDGIEFNDLEAFRKKVAGIYKANYNVNVVKVNLTYEETGE